jgi:catechol 2,3-dioxygenase-like lactoylglutathione lyase family enzyme
MVVKVPARLNVVTFGVRDLPAVRSFYEALGWRSRSVGDEFARFEIGGAVLALYSLDALAEEANMPPQRAQRGLPASPAPSLFRMKRWLTRSSSWCVKRAVASLPSRSHGNGVGARATSPIQKAMSGR